MCLTWVGLMYNMQLARDTTLAMSRRSGREKRPMEKAAALHNSQSKQKQAQARESKGKSIEKKRRARSSGSSSDKSDAAIAINKEAPGHTSKKSKTKSVKHRRKMMEEVVDEDVQDGRDEI